MILRSLNKNSDFSEHLAFQVVLYRPVNTSFTYFHSLSIVFYSCFIYNKLLRDTCRYFIRYINADT